MGLLRYLLIFSALIFSTTLAFAGMTSDELTNLLCSKKISNKTLCFDASIDAAGLAIDGKDEYDCPVGYTLVYVARRLKPLCLLH